MFGLERGGHFGPGVDAEQRRPVSAVVVVHGQELPEEETGYGHGSEGCGSSGLHAGGIQRTEPMRSMPPWNGKPVALSPIQNTTCRSAANAETMART